MDRQAYTDWTKRAGQALITAALAAAATALPHKLRRGIGYKYPELENTLKMGFGWNDGYSSFHNLRHAVAQ
ncbi:hypothetical protein GTP58_27760 [Duganella sp. CY15W]|uniref:hypothetical protein n=1 Tax=Duganella sp. CY15W TaxID=2692172 RepID=UPI00136FD18F|nr:hypothetical protein [Duganella sp. CY15W]MYM32135.1 hypothetical protein [Duganella sp. CY15W]